MNRRISRLLKNVTPKTFWVAIVCVFLSLLISHQLTAQTIQVRLNRWLEVRQISGTVTLQKGGVSRNAQIGTRLEAVGDAITTQARSNASLNVDTDIGMVEVSANTTVRVQSLQSLGSGGRVTRLQVTRGQARLRVRPFLHPDSQLEIETPAGVSAVRGTQFGIAVLPNGSTSVATLEGSVLNISQGERVAVNAGFSSIMIPGKPPTRPQPLQGEGETGLRLQTLTEESKGVARIIAQVNPINLVTLADRSLSTDSDGQFSIQVPLPTNRQITVVVTTPLGKQQVYELAVP